MPSKKKTMEEVDDTRATTPYETEAVDALVTLQNALAKETDDSKDNLDKTTSPSDNEGKKGNKETAEANSGVDEPKDNNDKNSSPSDNKDNQSSEKGADANSSDDNVPIAVAFRRRNQESATFTGALSSVFRPTVFEAAKDMPLQTMQGPHAVSSLCLQTISFMVYLYDLANDTSNHSTLKATALGTGYSFPLKDFISKDDRHEIQELSKQNIMDDGKKVPQVWIYFYPSTKTLFHKVHDEFFGHLFPNDDDKSYIETVGQDENTSMICVALHDKVFNEHTILDEPTNNIIAAVSFRILPQTSFHEETGAYIYYLGTLQNVSFHEVVQTNGTMNEFRFPIERNGLGELLLRLTQLLSLNIRDTFNMFLVANTTSSINKYYKKLNFKEID